MVNYAEGVNVNALDLLNGSLVNLEAGSANSTNSWIWTQLN
jgi:hypothetical protein